MNEENDTMRDTSFEEEMLQQIIGEQLSSVTFVQDYVQLNFDGPGLTAVTWPIIEADGREFRWNELGFRDELCKRITRKVTSARISHNEALSLSFDDHATVKISLKGNDYRAAEAVRFDASPTQWWVL